MWAAERAQRGEHREESTERTAYREVSTDREKPTIFIRKKGDREHP
jgi:hypothetical protein